MSRLPTIPTPPDELTDPYPPLFKPAPDLPGWIEAAFIDPESTLHNPDHRHLEHARLAVLWTNVENVTKGRRILGQAKIGEPSGSDTWSTGRQEQQLERWFGRVPDFLITLDSLYVTKNLSENPAAVLALIEHELYHCAQDTDKHGMPAFNRRTGRPKWTIRPHDIEEFVGVAKRYGAVTAEMAAFRDALENGPTVAPAAIQGVCGTCGHQVG